jgi:hypothetical protein
MNLPYAASFEHRLSELNSLGNGIFSSRYLQRGHFCWQWLGSGRVRTLEVLS